MTIFHLVIMSLAGGKICTHNLNLLLRALCTGLGISAIYNAKASRESSNYQDNTTSTPYWTVEIL